MNKLEKICLKILRVGVVVVFFIPLIYSSVTIFPFIFPKSLAFRFLIDLLAAPYFYLMLVSPLYRPRRSNVLNAVVIFLGIEFLATILGYDPLRSFWGNHERMMGFYMYAHVVLFFFIAVSVYRTKEEWRRLLFYAIVAGAVVTGIGYIQYFSKSFLHEVKGGRIYSTFGNSIYLAAYLLFHMYLVLWYALTEKRVFYKYIFYALLVFEFIAFLLARTRGAIIALVVSGTFLFIMFVWRSVKSRLWLIVCLGILPVILGVSMLIFGQSDFIRENKLLAPLAQINLRQTTAQTRLLNWKVGLRAWASRPLLGWGPENYYMGFNKFYDPKFLYYGQYETWQDHAHNFVVDTLSDSGILGLGAFLAIYFFAISAFVKLWKKGEHNTSAVFISIFIAYLVQDLFAFDTLGVWIMIYAILGYAHICVVPIKEHVVSADAPVFLRLDPVIRLTFVLALIFASVFTAILTNVIPFNVSAQTIKAGAVFPANPQTAYELITTVLDRPSPYKAESRDELSKVVSAMLQRSQNLTRDDATRLTLKVYSEFKKNLAAHPRDVYFNLAAAQWSMLLGSFFDPVYFLDAEDYLLKAKELSPKRQQIYFSFMRLYILRGRFAEAAELGRQAVALEPNVSRAHWQYGEALARNGDEAAGYKEMGDALIWKYKQPYFDWTLPEMEYYISLTKKMKDDRGAAWWSGVLSNAQGDSAAAYVNMEKAVKEGFTPCSYDQLMTYMNVAEEAGHPVTDTSIVDRMLGEASYPEAAMTIVRGKMLINRGELKEARKLLAPLRDDPQYSAQARALLGEPIE